MLFLSPNNLLCAANLRRIYILINWLGLKGLGVETETEKAPIFALGSIDGVHVAQIFEQFWLIFNVVSWIEPL